MPTINAINSNIPIEIAKGGTNSTTMSNAYGVNYFDGTSIVTSAVGTATQVFTSNGAGSAPTFEDSAVANDVSASANLTDDYVVTGNGGVKGVQTSTMKIDANGQMTNTSQPAFSSWLVTGVANTTGAGNVWTLGTTNAMNEIFDNNADFTNPNFTAPVTDRYYVTSSVAMGSITAAMTYGYLGIISSNRSWYFNIINSGAIRTVAFVTDNLMLAGSQLIDMDAGDTVYIVVGQNGGAGDTASVLGSPSCTTSFSAFLVC